MKRRKLEGLNDTAYCTALHFAVTHSNASQSALCVSKAYSSICLSVCLFHCCIVCLLVCLFVCLSVGPSAAFLTFKLSVFGNFLCSSSLPCSMERMRDSNTEYRTSSTFDTYRSSFPVSKSLAVLIHLYNH